MKRNLFLFITGFVIILFVYGLLQIYPGSYKRLETFFYDLRDYVKTTILREIEGVRDEIIIVDVDDKSVKKLGRFHNWPRYYFGKAINEVESQNPAVIGIDFIFSESDSLSGYGRLISRNHLFVQMSTLLKDLDSTQIERIVDYTLSSFSFDEYVSSSIGKSGKVILASYLTQDTTDKPVEGYDSHSLRLITPDGARLFKGMITPIHKFMRVTAGIGIINSMADPDGVRRKTPVFFEYNGKIFPSFALAVAKQMAGGFSYRGHRLIIGGRYIWLDDNNNLWINYQGDFRTFRYISFVDLLRGDISDNLFTRKIVLFGSSSSGIGDISQAPFHGMLPSIEVHANIIHNLLYSEPIRSSSNFVEILLVILMVFLVLYVSNRLAPYISPVITVIIIGTYFTFVFVQYSINLVAYEMARPAISIIISFITGVIYRINILEKEKKHIRDLFSRYVPEEVVKEIIITPNFKLEGERREISVLISDIRGFTPRVEIESPEFIVEELNSYFEEMADIIFRHGGMIDKYMGDGILSLFGAPIYHPAHADRALSCAIEMQRRLRHINRDRIKRSEIPIKTGIAINSGEAIIGNIGSSHRADYTAIGDVVNVASRLEPLNKEYKTEILITESLRKKLKGSYRTQLVGKILLKGKTKSTTIYAVSVD